MAILFSRIADSTATAGNVNTVVPTSIWNHIGESDEGADADIYYRNDTPVSGHTYYFRNDCRGSNKVPQQNDAYNRASASFTLTSGSTYYFGGFYRFDRINGLDIWHDTSQPDSYDKLMESQNTAGGRWIILAGWPNSNYLGSYNGKFTFDLYSSPSACAQCGVHEKWANVSPYGQNNPYLCDYNRWYAVTMLFRPSSGTTANGLVELYINGTKTTSLTQSTQDGTNPSYQHVGFSGTIAQPAEDAPPHYRKFDCIVWASSLSDITSLGLMSDPTVASDTTPPSAPTGVTIR